VFRWTCLPKAKAKRLREDFDDLGDDAEVRALRSVLLLKC